MLDGFPRPYGDGRENSPQTITSIIDNVVVWWTEWTKSDGYLSKQIINMVLKRANVGRKYTASVELGITRIIAFI